MANLIEAAEGLLDRKLTSSEISEGQGYDDLREALRAARDDAGVSQVELASQLNVGQSEVSRLETAVGPNTRIGRIRNYLTACKAKARMIVRTVNGHEFSLWADGSESASDASVDWMIASPASAQLTTSEAQYTLLSCILAFDEVVGQRFRGDVDELMDIRREFLLRLIAHQDEHTQLICRVIERSEPEHPKSELHTTA